MSAVLCTLIRVDATFPGKEEMAVTDVILGTQRRLCDRNMSRSGWPGMLLSGHVVVFNDFCMATGGAIPVDADLLKRAPEVQKLLEELVGKPETATDPARRARFARPLIAAALRNRYSERIGYQ